MKMRRGAYVTEVNAKDQTDVYHLLSLLESDAAGVVASRASARELQDLQDIHAELAIAVGDTSAFFAVNERFHMRLLEIADNRWRDQLCADLRNHLRRADPSEGNRDDLITRADLQRAQDYFQTVRAAGHRDGMTTAHIIGEGVFQRLDLRSHNEAPMLKNAVDRFVDGGLEFEILGLEIDEIHGSVLALHMQRGNTPNDHWLISQGYFCQNSSMVARIFCHYFQ